MSLYLLLLAWASALAGTLSVEVLDVGQGDSILLQTPAGKTILIDGGTGRRNVANLLERRSIEQVDLMVATHAHADHIGGLDEVMDAVPVRVFVDSGVPHTTETYKKVVGLVEQKTIPYKAVRGGQVFRFDDGIVMTVLGPYDPMLRGTRSDLNSNSVITRVDHRDVCFLFMGDAELETEHQALEHGLESCEVLKVAHHGSAHASSKKFLDVVQPEWAAISVGRNNRYKHPAPGALRRLENAGAKVLRTDHHGRITFLSNGKKVKVSVSVAPPESPLPKGVVHKPLPRHTPTPTPPPDQPARVVDADSSTAQARARLAEKTGSQQPATRDTLAAKTGVTVDGKVNMNLATRDQLLAVPGIGPAKADAILRYRKANGPFSAMKDVDNVPGIGPATLAKLSQHLFVP